MLYTMVPAFESVDKILKSDQWKEATEDWVLSCVIVFNAVRGG